MSLEGLTLEELERYERELLSHMPETRGIGNRALMTALGWQDDARYWDIRNRLIERGILVQGRGQGGSVRRLLPEVHVTSGKPSSASPSALALEELVARESDLYEPMAEVIKNKWAKEHHLDFLLVEITASQGSRPTKGKWTRPDITVASYTTYAYVPGRHFEVITFEIKPHTLLDVTVVYEALGHRRASTRAYALLHVPAEQAETLESVIDDICLEAKRHGVGVVVAARPDDYNTWEEMVEAIRYEPDPARLNEFLTVQMSQGFREQIIRWFK